MPILPTQMQHRPRFIKNTSDELMPAFGAGVIVPGQTYGQFVSGNEIVHEIRKPTIEDVVTDPGAVIFNGPISIKPGKIGVGTQDWPARALHNGSEDGTGTQGLVGLKADSWYLWSTSRGFICIGHDVSDPLERTGVDESGSGGGLGNIHTIWVKPSISVGATTILLSYSGSAGPADKFQPATAGGIANAGFGSEFPLGSPETSEGNFKLPLPGVWMVMFQAEAGPDVTEESDEGRTIRISLYGESGPTPYSGQRKNIIDDNEGYGPSGGALRENVAFSGILYVDDVENEYSVRNASTLSESVRLDAAYLIAVHLAGVNKSEFGE